MMLDKMIFQPNFMEQYVKGFQRYYTKIVLGNSITLGSDLVND